MLKTVEAVSSAHPDKLCDQISDLILDKCLDQDPESRVAVETCGGHGKIFITGEITTNAEVDYVECAKKVLQENRYSPDDYSYIINIVEQSNDIANGVDTGGAGDQGIMVGYATRETKSNMPLEYEEARKILKILWDTYPDTRDSKSQVTTNNGIIETVVVSGERLSNEKIQKVLDQLYSDQNITYHINPCGPRDNGGFATDAGVTGRKLAVDNYGPQIEIGGGAFSGKDPSKVDRSAAYMARNIAVEYLKKNSELQWVKTKLAYAIGVASPVMITIETNEGFVEYEGPDCTPEYIIQQLDLKKPKFYQTAKRGHFGNGFDWD